MTTPIDSSLSSLTHAEKKKLLKRYLEKMAGNATVEHPMSYGQKSLWILHQANPDSYAYNLAFPIRITSAIDVSVLKQACQELLNRHEALRTTFDQKNGEPIQVIRKREKLHFKTIDAIQDSWDELTERIMADYQQPFDLKKGPVFRVSLYKIANNEYILLFALHHISIDIQSVGVLHQELADIYSIFKTNIGDLPSLPKPFLQCWDYIKWQNELVSSSKSEKLWSYWQKQLEGELPVLDMPTDFKRPRVQTFNGSSCFFDLGPELTSKIRKLTKAERLTIHMMSLALFQLLLHRYSGQDEILVGSPVSGRSEPGFEKIVGYLINMLVMRTDFTANPTFRELLKQVRTKVIEALNHQDFPFSLLVEKLQPKRDISRSPIFQVTFEVVNDHQFQSSPKPSTDKASPDNLIFEQVNIPQQEGQFDLWLIMFNIGESITGVFNFNTDLFRKDTIEKMIGHYKNLISDAVSSPDIKISDLVLFDKNEQDRFLTEHNHTESAYPQDKCLHQLFEEQVKRTPENIAVAINERTLTFAELNERANRLAELLIQKGIGPNKIVSLLANRSINLVIGILGVLKAGGAYLPIDPDYPQSRIEYILEDSGCPILLTQKEFLQLPGFKGDKILLDDLDQLNSPGAQPETDVQPGDLVYLIYTSGSTGNPKGTMVEHQGAVNYISWAIRQYGNKNGTDLCFPLYSSISFDLTVTSIFTPLLSGNRIEIYPEKDFVIDKILREDKVDIIKLTPSHLRALKTETFQNQRLHSFIVGGEQLETKTASDISQKFDQPVKIYNEYGPTETVVGCMIYQYDPQRDTDTAVPIGVPADNVKLYIFNEHQKLIPPNGIGELHIGGDGVARGYLNRQELTDERFIKNPYLPEERIYRTGDLVRKRRDGIIEYLGRVDNQVKLRGYRIECSEIETCLAEIEGINQVIVTIGEDIGEEKSLYAYYSGDDDIPLEVMRKALTEKLPHYMVPSHFIKLDAIPLTPNGKVDHKALPKNDPGKSKTAHLAPRNDIEKQLATIWAEILNLKEEEIGVLDNFLELGGNSILAIQITQLASRVGISFKSHQILENQTIAELTLVAKHGSQSVSDQKIVSGFIPLTPIQKRFFEEVAGDPHNYNQYACLSIQGKLDKTILNQAMQAIIKHHDALRICFVQEGANWIQQNKEYKDPYIFNSYDLSGLPEQDQTKKIQSMIHTSQAEITLSQSPPMWMKHFELSPERDYLVISIHHLVTDIVSWGIILEDLETAYRQLEKEQPVQLPPKTDSFKLWAENLVTYAKDHDFAEEITFWDQQFEHAVKPLPLDYPESADLNTEDSSTAQTVTLDIKQTKRLLKDVPQTLKLQVQDFLLASVCGVLSDWIGDNRILIDMEGHGRENIGENLDITRTVGWFTSLYPTLFTIDASLSNPVEYISSIQRQREAIPHKGFNYGTIKYEKSHKAWDQQPKSEILFNFMGQTTQISRQNSPFKFDYLGLSSGEQNRLRHPLTINLSIHEDQLHTMLVYSNNLFEASTIEALLEGFNTRYSQVLDKLLKQIPVTGLPQAMELPVRNSLPIPAPKKVCKKCILPDTFPDISFDDHGICNYCNNNIDVSENDQRIHFDSETEIIDCLQKYKKLNKRYDVLVPLSGGVDSSAALINIVEKYQLKVLGWHNDHGYEDATATENVKKLCKALDVDLIVQQHDMAFMKKLWRYTQEAYGTGLSGCFVCGGVLYANALEIADRFGIPLIINGYSKGQAEMMSNKKNAMESWEKMISKFQEDESFFNEFLERQKPMNKQKIVLSRRDLEQAVDPTKILVMPFYLFRQHKTDKKELRKVCESRFDWQPMEFSFPNRTTNCEMVWLNTYFDLHKMNYTMYHEEYSSLVRKGEITREQAQKDLNFDPPEGLVEKLAEEIGLDPNIFFSN